jgi:predicted dehydrogenase/nucleoside-diphosphate-sugar epimerase
MNEEIRHRVGIVGAGQISEFHVAALKRIAGVELLGVYDIDAKRAQDAARRFGTRAVASLEAFRAQGADVVHVLTPPETHAAIALEALRLGMHVLVEKPLATDVEDCRRIVAEADLRGLRVCVNHSMLYDPQVRRALEAVRAGRIGKVISVDILRSGFYPTYAGGPLPPHYRSAGYPFRDLGVHALYLFEAFLGPIEDVQAQWASFGGDKNLVFDEWRAQVRCRSGLGQFQLSWNIKPIQNLIIVQGSKGVLRVDAMRMSQGGQVLTRMPKPVDRVLGIYSDLLAPVIDYAKSAAGVVRKTIRPYHGLQELIADFYRTLDHDLPVPVSAADAIPVVDWVERVARAAEAEAAANAARAPGLADDVPILVTGAAGALGSAIVARLLERGERVRVFVRKAPPDVREGIEVCTGDLRDPTAVERAVRGARVVVHAGAAMRGDWGEMHASTVVGTQNVVEACLKHGVEQLVYISSMAVPQWSGAPKDAPLTESSPLEPRTLERDSYCRAKLEAELLVSNAVREQHLPAVLLRPGLIFGGPLPLVSAAVARRVGGRYIVLGDGNVRPPFVYLDDVVDAVVSAIDHRLIHGEIVQIIDTDVPTQNEVLRKAHPDARVMHLPRLLVFALGKVSETILRGRSPFTLYRLRSALAKRTYVSESARLIGWEPSVGVSRGIDLVTTGASGGAGSGS